MSMDCEILNELRLEGKLCDVVIKVGNVDFKAHKNILCGCSSYFRALFTSTWKSSEKEVFTIPGISPAIMELIIQYAYTHTVNISAENVEALLSAADQLDVLGLVHLCCDFMGDQLCPHNCIGILRCADLFSCHELYERAFTYVLQHFEEVVWEPVEEFLELTLPQLSNILEKDELNVRQEETVFEAVKKWIQHAPEVRSNCIVALLPKVRMGLMEADYFLNKVRKSPLVSSYQECQPIITHALKVMFIISRDGPTYNFFLNPLSCPRLPHSILFAIGGWSGSNPTNVIEAYDSRADHWMLISSAGESPRAYHGTAFLNGFIYVIGGFDRMEYFSTVRKFNPITQTWHHAAPMHSSRCYVSVTVLDSHIYVMGGFNGIMRLNTAERYEPKTNQWSLISPMHEQRSDASATTFNCKVYICGGFNGRECLFTAECFDPQTDQWTMIAPMLMPRSGAGVAALRDQVFVVGGFDGINRLSSVEAYSPQTDSWSVVSSMCYSRSHFGIEVMDDRLYVAGGFNGESATANCEYYEEKTDNWFAAQDMHTLRSALSCCMVSGLPNVTEYTFRRYTLQLDNFTANRQAGAGDPFEHIFV